MLFGKMIVVIPYESKMMITAQPVLLDDGYRADNRYGPKPKYNDDEGLKKEDGAPLTVTHKSGDAIVGRDVLISNSASADTGYGLDGYWERSAIANGLRIVVGQRLELGDYFGWKESDDPLYPPSDTDFELPVARRSSNNFSGYFKPGTDNLQKGAAETLQMRSLRDNLAAVQGLVVYHSADSAAGSPLACVAATSHPGTQETLEDSRTFEQYSYVNSSGQRLWETNFLTGRGTKNGVEFAPPSASFGPTISGAWLKHSRTWHTSQEIRTEEPRLFLPFKTTSFTHILICQCGVTSQCCAALSIYPLQTTTR